MNNKLWIEENQLDQLSTEQLKRLHDLFLSGQLSFETTYVKSIDKFEIIEISLVRNFAFPVILSGIGVD